MATVNRAELVRALAFASRARARKGSMPILANVRLDTGTPTPDGARLRLTCTNLETTAYADLPMAGELGGELTVNAELLAKMLRGSKSAHVTLTVAGDALRVVAGGAETRLPGTSVEEWPNGAQGPVETAWSGEAATLAEAFRPVLHAVSADETRYNLNGVRVESVRTGWETVATDGHRLAHVNVPGARLACDALTVPTLAAELALEAAGKSALAVLLVAGEGRTRRLGFAFGCADRIGRSVWCREIAEEFPSWRQIRPSGDPDTIVWVDAAELVELVKAALPSAHARSSGMKFRVNGALEVEASTPDTGTFKGAIECEKRGLDAAVCLSGRYLIDAAEALGGTLTLELWAERDKDTGEVVLKDGQPIEARRVVRLTGTAGDALLMPMRL